MLVSSAESTRYQLADLARAIGRLGAPESLQPVVRLLDEDLARRRRAMETVLAARARETMVDMSDARTFYVQLYRIALIKIGTDEVVASMASYLVDPDFCFEAANVLKIICDRRQDERKEQRFGGGIDYSDVAARREARQNGAAKPIAPEADAIFAAVERLLLDDKDGEAHARAIGLASIGVTLPCGDKTDVVQRLLDLPLPVQNKQRLMIGWILAGECVTADSVIEGIRAYLDDATKQRWMLENNNQWALDLWLGLLPFTDRPEATITGVEMVCGALSHPRRMEEVVRSLSLAPGEAAERTLHQMASRFPAIAGEYEWNKALIARRSVAGIGMLLDLMTDPALPNGRGTEHAWSTARDIAALASDLVGLKEELLRRFEVAPTAPRLLIEHALAKIGGPDVVVAIVRNHAATGRPFDGLLDEAIRETALSQEPVAGWTGAFELHPVAVPELRSELFAMLDGTPAEAAVANACLTAIDSLRDEYGAAGLEPRHPDITSGRPWPLVA